MRILFWTSGFWPSMGGLETQALLFVQKMQQKGHFCQVLTQKGNPDQKDEEIYEGIPIRRFDFKRILFNRGAETFGSIRAYLDSLLISFRPDILHLNGCFGECPITFSMLRNLFSIPALLTIHAPHLGVAMPQIVRKVSSQVDRVCCVSQWVVRETEALLPEIKEKIRLIYNGIPLFAPPPAPLPFSPPVLLIYGRLSPEKGFDCAIQAFSLLKKRGSSAKLLIGGDGMERENLFKMVSDFGLNDSVEFIGPLNRDEIPHTINRAAIVIVPSYFESFGLVALEAMQMGRPVIGSNIGGLPEIISSNELGILVPPKDPIALCNAIEELIQTPEKAIAIGTNARSFALNHFTIDQNGAQYESLYKELL